MYLTPPIRAVASASTRADNPLERVDDAGPAALDHVAVLSALEPRLEDREQRLPVAVLERDCHDRVEVPPVLALEHRRAVDEPARPVDLGKDVRLAEGFLAHL